MDRFDWRWKSKSTRPFELRVHKGNGSKSTSDSLEAFLVTVARLDRERVAMYEFTLFAIDTGNQHTGSTEVRNFHQIIDSFVDLALIVTPISLIYIRVDLILSIFLMNTRNKLHQNFTTILKYLRIIRP